MVKSLPHGILMKTVDLKIRNSEWTIVVTMEADPDPYNDLAKLIHDLSKNQEILAIQFMVDEVKNLRRRLEVIHRHRRPKRGLIDGVGMLAHSLFGIATDGDVKEIRSKIEENRQGLQEMSTWAEDMTSVINASYQAITHNRKALNDVIAATSNWVAAQRAATRVKRVLDHAEEKGRHYRAVIDDLEDGRLTERIFPQRLFMELQGRVDGHWLSREWYYQWVTVHPRWSDPPTFIAKLPMISTRDTIDYELHTFPIFGPNIAMELILPNIASKDTATGLVQEPRHCLGSNPTVCDPGPVHPNSCVAGLLSGQLKNTCNLQRVIPQGPYVLGPNELVMIGPVSELIERCPNINEQSVSLPDGAKLIKWTPGCHLESNNFILQGVRELTSNLESEPWVIPELDIPGFQGSLMPTRVPDLLRVKHIKAPKALDDITWSTDWSTMVIWIWLAILTAFQIIAIIVYLRTNQNCTFSRSAFSRRASTKSVFEAHTMGQTRSNPKSTSQTGFCYGVQSGSLDPKQDETPIQGGDV